MDLVNSQVRETAKYASNDEAIHPHIINIGRFQDTFQRLCLLLLEDHLLLTLGMQIPLF